MRRVEEGAGGAVRRQKLRGAVGALQGRSQPLAPWSGRVIGSVCAPPCIKSQQHSKHFPTSPLGQYYVGSLLLNFGGQKRSSAFRRIWPLAAAGKLLGS